MNSRRLSILIFKWHRRLGLAAALFVLMLVVTGLLLNHTESLQLQKQPLKQAWLLNWYGIEAPKTKSFLVAGNWFSGSADKLFINGDLAERCPGGLTGVAEFSAAGDQVFAVVCGQQMQLYWQQAGKLQLLEIVSLQGLLPLVTAVALHHEPQFVYLKTHNGASAFNTDTFEVASIKDFSATQLTQPTPKDIEKQISKQQTFQLMNMERVMLDLHSGRIFGQWGVYLVDAAAIIFLLLALTGFYMWWRTRHIKRG